MTVHVYDIDRTLEELLQKTLQADDKIDAGFHFNTNVNITTLMLLSPGYGAKDTQRANSKLSAELIFMGFNEVDVFACLFHLLLFI